MTDERDDSFDDATEPGTIGVGMGGSCPVCRAPVDLGQEFCLECGSPIRFTPRQRRKQSSSTSSAVTPPSRKSGFPWIPFLIVLALVGGGVILALVDGGDSKSSSSKDSTTESALPEVKSSVPETTSTTQTTTLQDCNSATASPTGTQPATTDPAAAGASGVDGQIPSVAPNGTTTNPQDPAAGGSAFDAASVPSTGSGSATSNGTVTVDQNGNLCPSAGSSTTPTTPTTTPSTPTSTDSSTGTTTGSGTSSTTSGTWPAGKQGWTAVAGGSPNKARAQEIAIDVQDDGFTDGGVLFSSDFTSMCPGVFVAYSGVFDTEKQAKERVAQLKAKSYDNAYAREVRTTGAPAEGCP